MTSDETIPSGAELPHVSRAFTRIMEAQGSTGAWTWTFADHHHAWSPNLFRMCGLPPDAAPSYALLLSLAHPEDRIALETPADIVQGGHLRHHTFRIVRPDGTMRILSSRGEVYFTPDGRPRSAAAVLFDVTQQEQVARAQAEERRRRRALFDHAQTWINTAAHAASTRSSSDELLSLTGLSQAEFQDDCLRVVTAEDRSRVLDTLRERLRAQQPFTISKRLALADGGSGDFRFVYVPVRNEVGAVQGWATLASRLEGPAMRPEGVLKRGLEEGIKGSHVRGARALLDWSMSDLARASKLSLSTIRRLEEDGLGEAARSLPRALAALRQAGIAFLLVEGGGIAIVRP